MFNSKGIQSIEPDAKMSVFLKDCGPERIWNYTNEFLS
jgi:hypothetical protein